MSWAYGTPVRSDLAAAEREAVARHSHYYTEAVGWVIRAEAVRYSVTINEFGDYGSSDPRVELFAFPVVRWTPCGATIVPIWGTRSRAFVDLRDGAKQYASRTAKEAVAQLVERRRRMIWVLNEKLARAENDKEIAQRLLQPDVAPAM